MLARLVGAKTVSTTPPSNATATVLTSTTTTKNLPSDTLLTTLLATGSILVLAGLLYSRISAIKVPGGGEVDFITADDKQQVQDKVAEAIANKKTDKPVSDAHRAHLGRNMDGLSSPGSGVSSTQPRSAHTQATG